MLRFLIVSVCTLALIACATTVRVSPYRMTTYELSQLQQGRRYFEQGYYRSAMRRLLPLACDGIAEAQYAVGYMYYYGYGVAQDTEVGFFWIQRAASKHFAPAIKALAMIATDVDREPPTPKPWPPKRHDDDTQTVNDTSP